MSVIDLEPDPTLDDLVAQLAKPVQSLLKCAADASTQAQREAYMTGVKALLQGVEDEAQRAWKREFGIESGPTLPAPQVLTDEAKGCVSQAHVHATCTEAVAAGDLLVNDTCPWCRANTPAIEAGPPQSTAAPGPVEAAPSMFSPANTSIIHVITDVGTGSIRKPGAPRLPRKKRAS